MPRRWHLNRSPAPLTTSVYRTADLHYTISKLITNYNLIAPTDRQRLVDTSITCDRYVVPQQLNNESYTTVTHTTNIGLDK